MHEIVTPTNHYKVTPTILVLNQCDAGYVIQVIKITDYEQSLFFSVVRGAKRETRKWPRSRACIALTKSEEKEILI